MSTVFRSGSFRFFCNSRESLYEPPHVHVWFADADQDARINLVTGEWLEAKPPPKATQAMQLFRENRVECTRVWNRLHAGRKVV